MSYGKRCVRCGQIFKKGEDYSGSCLDGYIQNPDLCYRCNAAGSVIQRLKSGLNISMEECKKLPRTIIFDPKGDNAEEEALGKEFQKIIDSYMKKAEHK